MPTNAASANVAPDLLELAYRLKRGCEPVETVMAGWLAGCGSNRAPERAVQNKIQDRRVASGRE